MGNTPIIIRFRAAASLLLLRNAPASPPSPHPSPRQEIPLHPIRHFKTAVANKTGWRSNCAHPCNCLANLYHRCRECLPALHGFPGQRPGTFRIAADEAGRIGSSRVIIIAGHEFKEGHRAALQGHD